MPRRSAPRLAADPADADSIDRGITVKEAAEIIGCDESYVRKLLRRGKLAGYHLEHGVRVWLSSVRAYQRRKPYQAKDAPALPGQGTTAAKPRPGAKYREAVAGLQKLGLRFGP